MAADNLIPAKDRWEFDDAVTKVFDEMLEASIPSYREMRKWTTMLAKRHIEESWPNMPTSEKSKCTVVDLGASRGEAIADLCNLTCANGLEPEFILIEVSEPMRNVLIERFQDLRGGAAFHIRDTDLRYDYTNVAEQNSVNLVLSVLTLMFIPLEYRQRVVKHIHTMLEPGGKFIFVEKCLGETAQSDEWLTTEYYQFKRDNGYNDEAILRKKLSLEGVLVPLTMSQNEDMLAKAGFKNIQRYYQALNFAGWVAEK